MSFKTTFQNIASDSLEVRSGNLMIGKESHNNTWRYIKITDVVKGKERLELQIFKKISNEWTPKIVYIDDCDDDCV